MSTPEICPICRKPLAPHAPRGLCPECLLKAGFPTGTQAADELRRPRIVFNPPEPAALAPHFPQLEILGLIGQGGMGAVYRARQTGLDRVVALKILPPQAAEDPGFAERFTREARALAQLSHPHIVAVHEFGQSGGYHFLLMEYVDGVNLRRLLESGRTDPRAALAIVPQVCDALQFAHDRGIVHRDIKPENILLDKTGTVKIADFGLAKIIGSETTDTVLTGARDVMGTPHYMAPEQVERPLTVDHRADIYSVGVVFYQMLTGELPIGRFAVPSKKVQIDVRLDEIVLRALEKEPELRFQQASALRTEVETVATTRSGSPGQRHLLNDIFPGPAEKIPPTTPEPRSGLQWLNDGLTLLGANRPLGLGRLLFIGAAAFLIVGLMTPPSYPFGIAALALLTWFAFSPPLIRESDENGSWLAVHLRRTLTLVAFVAAPAFIILSVFIPRGTAGDRRPNVPVVRASDSENRSPPLRRPLAPAAVSGTQEKQDTPQPAQTPADSIPQFVPAPSLPSSTPSVSGSSALAAAEITNANFDTMEFNPEILRLQLGIKFQKLAESESRFKAGLVTANNLQLVRDDAALTEAKLAGDRVAFARIAFAAAERTHLETKARSEAGLVTPVTLAEAQLSLDSARIRLQQAESQAQREQMQLVAAQGALTVAEMQLAAAKARFDVGTVTQRTLAEAQSNRDIAAIRLREAEVRAAQESTAAPASPGIPGR